jgi:hypothetical protein
VHWKILSELVEDNIIYRPKALEDTDKSSKNQNPIVAGQRAFNISKLTAGPLGAFSSLGTESYFIYT